MFLSKKIRLFPTEEQELLMWKTWGCCRLLYNCFININSDKNTPYIDAYKFSNYFTLFKQFNQSFDCHDYDFLNEVSRRAIMQAVKNADIAFKRFFNKKAGFPKFKSRRYDKPTFYVRCDKERFYSTQNGCKVEKIGNIKTNEPLPKILKDQHYYDVHISYDNKYWYITVSYEVKEANQIINGDHIGIDLGIKDLAIVSNNNSKYSKKYKNINKSKKVRKIQKKIKRKQRKLTKQRRLSTKPLQECKNYEKTRKQIQLLNRKLTNIRETYIHTITKEIVKTKPSHIVMETLRPANLVKNRKIARHIAEAKWRFFIECMKYKCQLYGISFIQADKFYPSTQTCSNCGNRLTGKDKLTLKDRMYDCKICGEHIDRDINAAINLVNYI